MRALACALALVLAGCGDDATNRDGGADQSVNLDGGVGDQAASADQACVMHVFSGFVGMPATEQRLDCSCICVIDDFADTVLASFWGQPRTAGASYDPTANGLNVSVDVPDAGAPAFAGLVSTVPIGSFYLDGDFDLIVDFQLLGPLPYDAHVSLGLIDASSGNTYVVQIENFALGNMDDYSAKLASVPPIVVGTTDTQGTLELRRDGAAITAVAGGGQVQKFTGAGYARMQLTLTATIASCPSGGCAMQIAWRHARLTRGALVDRP